MIEVMLVLDSLLSQNCDFGQNAYPLLSNSSIQEKENCPNLTEIVDRNVNHHHKQNKGCKPEHLLIRRHKY